MLFVSPFVTLKSCRSGRADIDVSLWEWETDLQISGFHLYNRTL